METLVTDGVFLFIAIMGIVEILISNSVMKKNSGSKKYATYAGIGNAFVIVGLGLLVLIVVSGGIYKWISIVAGIFVGIIGIYNVWLVYKHVDAEHPLKESKNAGHLAIAVLQIVFGIVAIVCGL